MKKILFMMGSLLFASGCMATVTSGETRVTYLVPTAPTHHQTTVYVRPGKPVHPPTHHRVDPPPRPHQSGPSIARHSARPKTVPVFVPGAATRNSPQLRFW